MILKKYKISNIIASAGDVPGAVADANTVVGAGAGAVGMGALAAAIAGYEFLTAMALESSAIAGAVPGVGAGAAVAGNVAMRLLAVGVTLFVIGSS